jgi:membrane fusion protein
LRKSSIESEMRQQQVLLDQQTASMARRIDAIRGETEQFSREIALQSSRTDLASKSVERIRTLADSGFTSVTQLHQQQEQELDQRSKLRVLERTRSERQRELTTLKAEMDDLPLKIQTQLSNYSRELKVLDQELAESEARREIVIPAPQGGMVTGVQAEVGGSANITTPLMSIVPQGASLEAHLFAPSKAVGFILPGQKVLLRYQSFPYQKFGHYHGTVQSVSGSAISPAELPTQMAGLSSLVGTNEPIYRIVVRLDRQSVLAYGQNQPLQPGMQLDSDIMLEKRKLWEWMLEPLFTLTGRL